MKRKYVGLVCWWQNTWRHFPGESVYRPRPTGWPRCQVPEYLKTSSLKESVDYDCKSETNSTWTMNMQNCFQLSFTCYCQDKPRFHALPQPRKEIGLDCISFLTNVLLVLCLSWVKNEYFWYTLTRERLSWFLTITNLCRCDLPAKWELPDRGTFHPQTPLWWRDSVSSKLISDKIFPRLFQTTTISYLKWAPLSYKRDPHPGWKH